MTGLSSNLVDFGTALRMLADSQRDVTELVTKLDLLVNTTTPMTVDIELTSGTVTVDNLAMIKKELTATANNSAPIVQSMTALSSDGKQRMFVTPKDVSSRAVLVPVDSFNDADTGMSGFSMGMRNTARTVVIAEETEAHVSLLDLPEVLLVGTRWMDGDVPHSALKINMMPFTGDSKKFVTDRMYYTTMTVVNKSAAVFTVTIADKFGASVKVDSIPANGSIQYLFYSYPNKDTANVAVINKYGGI